MILDYKNLNVANLAIKRNSMLLLKISIETIQCLNYTDLTSVIITT